MSLRQKKNWIEESCNLRLGPDGFGLNKKERKLVLLEFHQSYGQGIRLREKQKSRKTRRELPVLSFFNSLTSSHQRKMSQLNFTVGVRGSISTNHPRLLSFASSLESLEKLGLSSSLRPNNLTVTGCALTNPNYIKTLGTIHHDRPRQNTNRIACHGCACAPATVALARGLLLSGQGLQCSSITI